MDTAMMPEMDQLNTAPETPCIYAPCRIHQEFRGSQLHFYLEISSNVSLIPTSAGDKIKVKQPMLYHYVLI